MSALPLGTHVHISGTLRKEHAFDSDFGIQRTYYARGEPPTMGHLNAPPISRGVVVGQRTIHTGATHHDYYDGATYVQDRGSARSVYLVAYHLRRKPVICGPDQVEPILEGAEE